MCSELQHTLCLTWTRVTRTQVGQDQVGWPLPAVLNQAAPGGRHSPLQPATVGGVRRGGAVTSTPAVRSFIFLGKGGCETPWDTATFNSVVGSMGAERLRCI